MLSGKENIVYGLALIAGDRSELPRQITGVAALGQRVRRPVFEVGQLLAIDVGGRRERARENLVQV
jgi:hypothetical protein